MPDVLVQVVWRRRYWLLWWSLRILGADALLAIAYPTVLNNTELDKTFGSRSAAISIAAGLAVGLFMVDGLAEQVKVLRPIREVSPWHWLLGTDPIRHGLLWESWVLPVAVFAALTLAGTMVFARRNLS